MARPWLQVLGSKNMKLNLVIHEALFYILMLLWKYGISILLAWVECSSISLTIEAQIVVCIQRKKIYNLTGKMSQTP